MNYGIVFWIAAVVTQVQEPAAKQPAGPTTKQAAGPAAGAAKPDSTAQTAEQLKEARRLLQNGRYAEAEEKLKAIRDDAKKAPGAIRPALQATLAGDLAECQASQGEYGKAIDGLKAAESENPKNALLPARLADLYLGRGDWEAAQAATGSRREARRK